MFNKISEFIKKEIVLCVAGALALLSMPLAGFSANCISYIDFNTIILLFCLMIVMAGLRKSGLFNYLADRLLSKSQNSRQINLTLILLCFFSSMFITNDVALITFVPFGIEVLKKSGQKSNMIFVVVLQTIGANLGSMLTPIGNPQNLYLYSLSGMSVLDFVRLMLPYTLVSFVFLVIFCCFIKSSSVEYDSQEIKVDKMQTVIYLVMFAMCLLTVAKILPIYVVLLIILIFAFLVDKGIFCNVDYSLLMTFVFFFVFIGNMNSVESFRNGIGELITGREVWISIFASQIISNVPSAVLLSGFTSRIDLLALGTNLGGLGTLIASMASLISYKLYACEMPQNKKKYFLEFTIWNLVFLVILIVFYVIC